MSYVNEIRTGNRFSFGKNWLGFLKKLNEERILLAVESLRNMLNVDNLYEKSFLDVGCGSGLFSLAARRLGARVFSFDYDAESVACTKILKENYFKDDNNWVIDEGSILDKNYLSQLGQFDIVYSWGVLHHTGNMWRALENVDTVLKMGGQLFIALYNRQQFATHYWYFIKRIYNKSSIIRPIIIALHLLYPTMPSMLLKVLHRKKLQRGMDFWFDLIDWLGGFPFEVATPEEIFDFYHLKGYTLQKLKTVGGKLGCNEYIFVK